ncbi:MAG: Ig-like domain-containing protein, partial [Clostridia bacterium]|nr:Ig-like domain-containing protein [Clostridia bacterium]
MVKRRFLTCLLALMATLCLTLFAVGCGEQEDKSPKVSLSATTLELGLFEEVTLTATLTNTDATIVWSSSDTSVITVADGKVTALGIGSAKVTAIAGSVKADCAITVNRGTLTPEFDALDDTLTLVKGSVFPLDASMVLSGSDFDRATVTYELVGTNGKISVDEDGVVSALDYGSQDVTVTATYNGLTLVTKTITVTVIETGEIQTGIAANALSLTATALGDDGVNTFETNGFKAIVNGQEVSNAITLVSSDSSIVEISGTKIVAKKQGTTTVTAKFTADSSSEYDVIITVNVTKETVTYKTDFITQSSNDATKKNTGSTAIDFSSANLPIALSEITKVVSGGAVVSHAADGNTLTLTDAPAGENEYTLITDRVDVVVNGLIYQTTISNADEYKAWFANIGSYVGYSILTADVNLKGALVTSGSWWSGTLDGRGHTVSNFTTNSGFMAQTNEAAMVKNLQIVNMVVDSTNGGVIGSSYTGHMENVLILAKMIGAGSQFSDKIKEQALVMSGEYNDCELENVIIVVETDNPDIDYYGYGYSYSQGNGITTRNTYLVFNGNFTLKRETATNNKTVHCMSVTELLSKIDASAFEDAGWTIDNAIPYMSNYDSAIEEIFYSIDGDLKAGSTVTFETSLFDAEYSLKNAVNGITLNGNTITIDQNVTAATAFTLVVKSANFTDVTVELPLQTYNYNKVTYGADYIAIKDGKTTLDVDKIPGFSGEVKKVTVNGIDANGVQSGNILTFTNNEINVQSIAVYGETDVYTFDVVVADVVVTNGSELFATLKLNGRQNNRRYIVLANDIQLDDTQFDSGFLMDFVFDGLGHTIYDGYEYSGLFCNDANGVTFKNVNFVNFKTGTSIFGGKFVGEMTFENVNFINTKFPGFNSATYLLYNVNYDGTEVLFKNCNFDFNMDVAHVDKSYQILPDDGKYKSITFENVKITANATIVKIGTDGYGANFTVNNLVITDKNDITEITYDGNPVASSSQTIVDLTKFLPVIDGNAIESVYIGGAETTFNVDGDILYINKAVLGMTDIDLYTESGVYTVAVTVKDYSTNVTYNADYVKSTGGVITFDLSKINGFTGTVTQVNYGNLILEITDSTATTVTVSGSTAWNTSNFTIHTATVGYKFSVLVVTDYISDEASWKSFMESGTQNRYAIVTADFNLASEYELKTAFICNVVIDGQNHVIGGENVYNWSGLFANSVTSATIKNLTFNKIKGFSSILGGSMNDVTFENIVIKNGFAPGSKYGTNLLFGSIGANKYLTFKDCVIALTIDNTLIDNSYVLGGLNDGSTLNFENTTITFNGTMVKPGETFNGAVWGETGVNITKSILRDKDDVTESTATYQDEYIGIVDGTVTVDFNKISVDIDPATITSVAVNDTPATWVLGENNQTLIITTDTYGEGKAIQITVDSGDVIDTISFEVIFATHLLSDNASFKDFYSKQRNNTYAVVTQDIELEETPEITKPGYFHTGATVNGLGHTVTNIYCYTGWYASCLGDGVLKNITVRVKSYTGAMSDELGNFTMENVTMDVIVPGGATTNYILGRKVLSGRTFTIKNSTINVLMDSALKEKSFVLANVLDGNINIINSTISSNGTMVMLGETYNGSAWGSGKVTLDTTSKMVDAYDTVSYADEYVVTNGSAVTVDLTKIQNVTVSGVTSAIIGTTACTATTSGTTVTI